MSKKAKPSFELKKIIWDIAATVGKDKPTEIQRQLDYELEKRRKDGNFSEDAPGLITISRIVKEINELDLEIVIAKLPSHVWKLRDDYQIIKSLPQGNGQTLEQPKLGLGPKLEPQTRLNLGMDKNQQASQESGDQGRWELYIYGGISTLSALITHISLFVVFGRGSYLQLLEAHGDTSDVPNNVGEFVPWLIDNLQTHRQKEIITNSTDAITSKGMDEPEAIRLDNAFKDGPCLPLTCNLNDVNVLFYYLTSFASHMRDQTFLFQPFLARRMEFGVALVQLAHSLEDECEYLERLLHSAVDVKRNIPIELGREFTDRYRSLGRKSIQTVNLISAHSKEL